MSARTAGDGVLHPVALGAVAVLALNDHWGKAAWPGLVTGKLSDLAGLLFFPLVLQAIWELTAGRRRGAPSRRVLVGAALLTALVFTLVKVSPAAAELYRLGFGVLRWPLDVALAAVRSAPVPPLSKVMLTRDVTDLLALPAVLGAVAVGWARAGPDAQGGRGAVGSDAMATSSVAGESHSDSSGPNHWRFASPSPARTTSGGSR